MPQPKRHAERKFGKSPNSESAEHPQSVLRPDSEKKITHKKSERAGGDQKNPCAEFSRGPKEQGKDQIELDQHREIPPSRVQIHEVHLDVNETQPEQAENDPPVDRFETRNEWRNQINNVRHPIHRVEPGEPAKKPLPPAGGPRFSPPQRRLGKRPAA